MKKQWKLCPLPGRKPDVQRPEIPFNIQDVTSLSKSAPDVENPFVVTETDLTAEELPQSEPTPCGCGCGCEPGPLHGDEHRPTRLLRELDEDEPPALFPSFLYGDPRELEELRPWRTFNDPLPTVPTDAPKTPLAPLSRSPPHAQKPARRPPSLRRRLLGSKYARLVSASDDQQSGSYVQPCS